MPDDATAVLDAPVSAPESNPVVDAAQSSLNDIYARLGWDSEGNAKSDEEPAAATLDAGTETEETAPAADAANPPAAEAGLDAADLEGTDDTPDPTTGKSRTQRYEEAVAAEAEKRAAKILEDFKARQEAEVKARQMSEATIAKIGSLLGEHDPDAASLGREPRTFASVEAAYKAAFDTQDLSPLNALDFYTPKEAQDWLAEKRGIRSVIEDAQTKAVEIGTEQGWAHVNAQLNQISADVQATIADIPGLNRDAFTGEASTIVDIVREVKRAVSANAEKAIKTAEDKAALMATQLDTERRRVAGRAPAMERGGTSTGGRDLPSFEEYQRMSPEQARQLTGDQIDQIIASRFMN